MNCLESLLFEASLKRLTGWSFYFHCNSVSGSTSFDKLMDRNSYDIVAVGTGFATSFFLHGVLTKAKKPLRILVLDAGPKFSHADQVKHRGTENQPLGHHKKLEYFDNLNPEKYWTFFTGYGGSSNCWWACTPRLLPDDFRTRSLFNVGMDWPMSYADLEPYYCEAEQLMNVSGDSSAAPYPRSRPYPKAPHRQNAVDKVLNRAFPNEMFSFPTARSSEAVVGQRPACCNNGVCTVCPIDAKFTVLNGLTSPYDDPQVELIVEAKVVAVEKTGNVVTSVLYRHEGREKKVKCDLAVLGANALFNPHIMLRSGFQHPELGKGLTEQVSRKVTVDLDGLDNYQGSTVNTALGYMLHGREHRLKKAGALIQTENFPHLRNERGRHLQRMAMVVSYEDYRLPENHVTISQKDADKAAATFLHHSEYTERGLNDLEEDIKKVLAVLPVEKISISEPWKTESHIMCTTPMGDQPETSITDSCGLSHEVRNLLVLGSSLFPTAAPSHPTLTISALSLRAADLLFSS